MRKTEEKYHLSFLSGQVYSWNFENSRFRTSNFQITFWWIFVKKDCGKKCISAPFSLCERHDKSLLRAGLVHFDAVCPSQIDFFDLPTPNLELALFRAIESKIRLLYRITFSRKIHKKIWLDSFKNNFLIAAFLVTFSKWFLIIDLESKIHKFNEKNSKNGVMQNLKSRRFILFLPYSEFIRLYELNDRAFGREERLNFVVKENFLL